jgi:transposase
MSLKALEIFTQKYSPAKEKDYQDLFTTNEILNALELHSGEPIDKKTFTELLTNMGYTYILGDGMQFQWLLKPA